MPNIDLQVPKLLEMDELAGMASPIHALHPLVKLIVTVVYIFVTVSFPKYSLSGLAVMVLYPAVLFAVSGISVSVCIYKLRIMLPLVCAVGILNPFFDRETLFCIGTLPVSAGMVSLVTLMLKGVLCLTASFLLAATTPIDDICAALRKLHVPEVLTTLLLLTYRHISVMMEELAAMMMAYRLRAPGQRGVHFSAWGSFLGQAMLRSMDRAQEIYSSMQLRGFCGDFWYADTRTARPADFIFCAVAVFLFLVCRYVDVARMIGDIVI